MGIWYCGEYFNTANNNDILMMKYSSAGGFYGWIPLMVSGHCMIRGGCRCVDDANNYFISQGIP
ncbi:MAG: hypothetical protein IPM91_10385 [Bacteroidetes bacterium]|nr:hypothetical protein [Bacteroidota bacterium]